MPPTTATSEFYVIFSNSEAHAPSHSYLFAIVLTAASSPVASHAHLHECVLPALSVCRPFEFRLGAGQVRGNPSSGAGPPGLEYQFAACFILPLCWCPALHQPECSIS